MASPVLSPKVLPVTHLSPVLPTVSAPLPETCAAQHPRAGRDARARARAREARDFRKGWHAQECIRVCVCQHAFTDCPRAFDTDWRGPRWRRQPSMIRQDFPRPLSAEWTGASKRNSSAIDCNAGKSCKQNLLMVPISRDECSARLNTRFRRESSHTTRICAPLLVITPLVTLHALQGQNGKIKCDKEVACKRFGDTRLDQRACHPPLTHIDSIFLTLGVAASMCRPFLGAPGRVRSACIANCAASRCV